MAGEAKFLVWILCCTEMIIAQDDPVVSTIYGDIQGNSGNIGGLAYNEFLGVPFAKPPVDDLRWQKPVVPEPWEGVRETKEFGSRCTQLGSSESSEDCLFVNVFVPGSVEELVSANENLPVIAHVHGGAYLSGGSDIGNSRILATNGQIIVVTISYRLNTLGFLSTQSDAAPGNYGLYDQVAALEWVRDNIAAFGGDASRVTIMGQSAGSASVSHLSLSPVAKGLFQRVIALSGSAAGYFGATSHQRLSTSRLAAIYDCPTTSDDDVMECLKEKSATSLNLLGIVIPPLRDGYVCTQIPVIDSELVSMLPIEAMEQGLNADYDLLTGATTHDGASFSLPFTSSPFIVELLVNFYMNPYENRQELVSLMFDRYPGAISSDLDTRQRTMVKVATDFVFKSRALKEVELHTKTSNRSTYFYEFRHQYSSTDPEWLQGTHAEDLTFVFGDESLQGDDARLSQVIQAYYSNFAYTGNPNEGPHAVSVEWPQFDPNTKSRLVESPEPFMEEIPEDLQEDLKFWDNIYDIMIPRVDFPDSEPGYNLEMLGMWNILQEEIEKAAESAQLKK